MRIRVLAHPGGQGVDERARRDEPLTFGVPLARGAVADRGSWMFGSPEGAKQFAQVRVLDRWADGTARWILVDAPANLDGRAGQEFVLEYDPSSSGAAAASAIAITSSSAGVIVDTGAAKFHVRALGRVPFDVVDVGGQPVLASEGGGLAVVDAKGEAHAAEIRSVEIEERGPLRSVVLARGVIGSGRARFDLILRAHFYAGHSTVRLLITLTNPNRAKHTGGFWDLGDPGSILIKDASFAFPLASREGEPELWGSPEIGAPWTKFDAPFELYQDSSGGEHWQSSNHLNRERKVPTTFRGYRLNAGARARSGLRASPVVALGRGKSGVAIAVPYFWQNFPKAIESDGQSLTVRLFPRQFGDLHELQGGERKTHECVVAFSPDGITPVPLAWARGRTIVSAAPEWCLSTEAVSFLAPLNSGHASLVNSAVDGPSRFELKRETVDEYGWRHFGEIYGDHEGVKHKGATPLVSHYNNQYDPIAGFAYQYLRTGDPRWQQMMCELAAHVVDIDVYHTSQDKSAYNRGMFWHTYHYGDADTATHRTFPRAGMGRIHGGGPSAGHNYTTGLLLHYLLTGDEASRLAVIQLAQYVIDLDDGRKTIFRWLDAGDTGHAALSAANYYGPGRGPANSLNALVDGHRLSGELRFLEKAERLLRRVIHPQDDIVQRKLDVPEQRWFYTMFLQSLGKYLERKRELGELDTMYAYGQASLLHYARWMVANEYPYLDKPEKLEFPTETWPAQDIRKSDVFRFAALHAVGDERKSFAERARFFHEHSIASLGRFATKTLARPVVVLLTSGFMESWSAAHPDAISPQPGAAESFGLPAPFEPQRARAERRAMWVGAGGAVAAVVLLWMMFVR